MIDGTGSKAVESPKVLEKKERGHFDQKTTKNNTVTAVGWNDNRSVYVASNSARAQPTVTKSLVSILPGPNQCPAAMHS